MEDIKTSEKNEGNRMFFEKIRLIKEKESSVTSVRSETGGSRTRLTGIRGTVRGVYEYYVNRLDKKHEVSYSEERNS